MADANNFPDAISEHEVFLIRRIRSGETELFPDLVHPYSHSLLTVLRSILRDPSDVEEVLQETMLKALVHLHQLHNEQNFRNWLLQIGRNEARTRQRRARKASTTISLSDAEETGEEGSQNVSCDVADLQKLPSEAAADNEFRTAIALVLNSLPPIYRNIFVLHDIKQVTLNEAVKILGISMAAGTSRLYRARQYIRQQLVAFWPANSRPLKAATRQQPCNQKSDRCPDEKSA